MMETGQPLIRISARKTDRGYWPGDTIPASLRVTHDGIPVLTGVLMTVDEVEGMAVMLDFDAEDDELVVHDNVFRKPKTKIVTGRFRIHGLTDEQRRAHVRRESSRA